MNDEARLRLQHLIAALERHLEAVISSQGQGKSESVDAAYFAVEEAFAAYEETLDADFGENLPFELPGDE